VTGLPPVIGHEEQRAALAAAAAEQRLPGALLFHGPAGVGKQRLALWLGQLLVCERPTADGPCGQCRGCTLTLRLEHPDVHWYFPMPRPKASGGPEKLAEALEEARAAELAARRAEPFRPVMPSDLVGLYLAQMQTLRRQAVSRPAMARRQVFIIGDAEFLSPQEATTEAANALLKILEEPPSDTTFILTASDPDELLPTIRSRLLPIRLHPLPIETVERVLREQIQADAGASHLAARLSEGSIGRALGFLSTKGEDGALERIRRDAFELLNAATADSAVPRLAAALATGAGGARGEFLDRLDFLSLWIRDLAAVATGAADLVVNIDQIDALDRLATRLPAAARGAPDALRALAETRGLARSNVNPQLMLASVLRAIGNALNGRIQAG